MAKKTRKSTKGTARKSKTTQHKGTARTSKPRKKK
jgi:hypothetical protein